MTDQIAYASPGNTFISGIPPQKYYIEAVHRHIFGVGNISRTLLPPALFLISLGTTIYTKGQYQIINNSTGVFAVACLYNIIVGSFKR